MGSRKHTTSHLELPFITDVYMLHAGSEIFHDAKVGEGGGVTCRCHDDITCGEKKIVNSP